MVLTGIGDYAYKRPKDGVLVVPIGCLRDWLVVEEREERRDRYLFQIEYEQLDKRMKYEVWGLMDEVWWMRADVWGLMSEVWGKKSEVWSLKSEVWSKKSEVWSLK